MPTGEELEERLINVLDLLVDEYQTETNQNKKEQKTNQKAVRKNDNYISRV